MSINPQRNLPGIEVVETDSAEMALLKRAVNAINDALDNSALPRGSRHYVALDNVVKDWRLYDAGIRPDR